MSQLKNQCKTKLQKERTGIRHSNPTLLKRNLKPTALWWKKYPPKKMNPNQSKTLDISITKMV
jgi:hypothetical protein